MVSKNTLAAVAYLFGIISGIIVYVVAERKDRFVRFHAVQCILFNIAAVVVMIALALLLLPFSLLAGMRVLFWPQMAGMGVVMALYGLLLFVVWIVLMVKAYSGEMFKLPVIGELAEQWTS